MNAYAAYDTIENRPALSFERRLSHPVEVVWRAITESDELEPLTGSGDACLLRLTVLLDSREKAARDGAGWHVCLDRLEQLLAGDDGPADPGRVRNNHAPWIWVSKIEP